ncbi:hypothetical protein [Streptacidiphilus sp. PAMC 29251]
MERGKARSSFVGRVVDLSAPPDLMGIPEPVAGTLCMGEGLIQIQ